MKLVEPSTFYWRTCTKQWK